MVSALSTLLDLSSDPTKRWVVKKNTESHMQPPSVASVIAPPLEVIDANTWDRRMLSRVNPDRLSPSTNHRPERSPVTRRFRGVEA